MHPYDEEDDLEQRGGIEPTPQTLAHWLEEQYQGDDRFESIEVVETGQVEDEDARVRFNVDAQTSFFVAVLVEESCVRVGMATEDPSLSQQIEAVAGEGGHSLTEFLMEAMGNEELGHEVQSFHDDVYYICNGIPFRSLEDLGSDVLRDEVIFYLEGYRSVLIDFIHPEEE